MYSKNPKNIAFDNRSQDRDHNIYTEEFLGGADTFIYINGERYNDISAIQYSVREQLKPVYGYSSALYDDIITGVRIVQGVIKVPVRNTSYNESLTFVPESESNVKSGGYAYTDAAPDWVYNYSPEISSDNQVNTGNGYVSLSKERINIINQNKESGIEITSENNVSTFNTVNSDSIIENTSLKYEPKGISSYKICDLKKGCIVKIITSINSYYLIEDLSTGKIGYVEKDKVEVA